jgi:hypothetical protein
MPLLRLGGSAKAFGPGSSQDASMMPRAGTLRTASDSIQLTS